MYPLIRRCLFTLEAERAHELALRGLAGLSAVGACRLLAGPAEESPVTLLGLRFPNRIGLAAGLDKNGDYLDALGELGFGFIELGTVTPRPQPGNARPRLFRLPEREALINRMGFNNKGIAHLVTRIRRRRYQGVLGVNIGKNRDTGMADAALDYRYCLQRVYAHADYVAVNVSSPNTPGLRELQRGDPLRALLRALAVERADLTERHGRRVPVLVKIAPDLDDAGLAELAEVSLEQGLDGFIATNTTLDHSSVAGLPHGNESGGLSGAPLRPLAEDVLARLRQLVGPETPIIGVGGVDGPDAACARNDAGADLVALYTGLIYRGPGLVRRCARALA